LSKRRVEQRVRLEMNVAKKTILKMPPVYTTKGSSRKKSAYSFKNHMGFQNLIRLHPKTLKVKCPKQECAPDSAAVRCVPWVLWVPQDPAVGT